MCVVFAAVLIYLIERIDTTVYDRRNRRKATAARQRYDNTAKLSPVTTVALVLNELVALSIVFDYARKVATGNAIHWVTSWSSWTLVILQYAIIAFVLYVLIYAIMRAMRQPTRQPAR